MSLPVAALPDSVPVVRRIALLGVGTVGLGGPLLRQNEIAQLANAQRHCGDAATVGAGLPLLATLRGLRAGGDRGCDNRVAIWSTRYRDRPLQIQGPGAGAGITAAALLDDLLRTLP